MNRSSIFTKASTVPEGWELLAAINESESYEVDNTEIWRSGDKFILVTASGCSCWGGEYEEETFDSLDNLERSVLVREGYIHNPSVLGAKELVVRARARLLAEKHPRKLAAYRKAESGGLGFFVGGVLKDLGALVEVSEIQRFIREELSS